MSHCVQLVSSRGLQFNSSSSSSSSRNGNVSASTRIRLVPGARSQAASGLRCDFRGETSGFGLSCSYAQPHWKKRLHVAAADSRSKLRRSRPPRPIYPEHKFHVMFHGFNWDSQAKKPWYDIMKNKVGEIAAAGFTTVWFPPSSQSVDKHGYLPTQLYDLNSSSYGNEAQLRETIDAFHAQNICCIADIVINHRSGWKQDGSGHWNVYEGGTSDKRLDWGPWALVNNDVYDSGGKGSGDSGESYGAAPDLDHSNKQVQDELTDWMNWMKAEIGFDGWRFDFVKGYSPKYTKIYCERTNPCFAVGEYWTCMNYEGSRPTYDQSSHRQQLCNWVDGTGGLACTFDFTTKGILQEAVKNEYWRLRDKDGKAPGLIGWYPSKSVTFVDNHDTGSTQRHWNFPDDKVLLGYVYTITHPGIPCVFWDHFFDWGMKDKLVQLLELRRNNGIHAESKLKILAADSDMYVGCVDDRLIVKLGSRMDMGQLAPNGTAWKMIMAGPDFAIWENMKEHAILPEPKLTSDVEEVRIDEAEAKRQAAAQAKQAGVGIKITSSMSPDTVNRIMQEVPSLVVEDLKSSKSSKKHKNEDEGSKKKKKKKSSSSSSKKKSSDEDEDEDEDEEQDEDDEDEQDEEEQDDNRRRRRK